MPSPPDLLRCAVLYLAAYLLNATYVTVFYHRGLTHGALRLGPRTKAWIVMTGAWVTGLDPKTWCCMHRLHHLHSDRPEDPHSPLHRGVFYVFVAQLLSYIVTMKGLVRRQRKYVTLVRDFDFPVSWINRTGLWYVPYLLHGAIAVTISLCATSTLLGLSYFLGITNHPLLGFCVNAFGHRFGYRNFGTGDNSRNNTAVAWLALGEGYQNNHHHDPKSANFARRWWEIDAGFGLCRLAERLGMIEIARDRVE